MNGLLRDALAEMISRKMFVLFVILTIVLLLGVWATWEVRIDMPGATGDEELGPDSTGLLVKPVMAEAFSKIMSVFIFFAVFAASGLIPRALERGRAEFLLSKPLSRTRIYAAKLLSIWLVYGLMLTACGLAVYVVAVLVHGGFDPGIFVLFAMRLAEFGIWLTIIGLVGVLFGSASWAMIVAFSVWVAQSLLSYHEQMRNFLTNQFFVYTIESLYYLFPKTGQMGDMAINLASGRPVESWLPLWSSLALAVILYFCAVRVFERRDY
jgi:ABC-type transport system involved in multi-copper enzyme maturation permease subunit